MNKFYTKNMIFAAAFLGGPWAGLYFLGKNYQFFGAPKEAKIAFYLGPITSILLFIVMAFIPESVFKVVPHFMIPLLYILIIANFVSPGSYQAKMIKNNLASGWIKASWWKVVILSLLFLIPTFITVIPGMLLHKIV